MPLEHSLVLIIEPRGRLLHSQVGRLSDEAVGGHFVTRAHLNDITDDQVPDRNCLHAASLATNDRNHLIAIQTLQLDKLRVLREIVVRADDHLDDQCPEDDAPFKPSSFRVNYHARNDTYDGKDCNEEQKPVVERLLERAAPSDTLWLGFLICTESVFVHKNQEE